MILNTHQHESDSLFHSSILNGHLAFTHEGHNQKGFSLKFTTELNSIFKIELTAGVTVLNSVT